MPAKIRGGGLETAVAKIQDDNQNTVLLLYQCF